MANLPESPAAYPAGVYQIETTDPVVGGVPNAGTGAGMSNIPHQQLADRTAWLKATLDALSAIALTSANSPRLLAQNGHFRFGAGGLMIQWGRLTLDAAGTVIAFPTPFPTACFGVLLTDMATTAIANAGHVATVVQSSISASSFTAFAQASNDPTQFASTPIFFVALGH